MKNRKAGRCLFISICIVSAGMFGPISGLHSADGEDKEKSLVLVDDGKSLAPIILYKDAPPTTRDSAEELAEYIEKISGAKPQIIEGVPDVLPEKAIWVGYQPVLKKIFPNIDFDFKYPEEIIIAATESNLVIAGRDRWDPGHMEPVQGKRGIIYYGQKEYGTANAVYTFLQDYLGVRWLWQGEVGEDIIPAKNIAFEPFEYRYHPKITFRSYIMFWWTRADDRGNLSVDWSRKQRLLLDSSNLQSAPDGHAFMDWWERFGKTHLDYFALQPDGSRGPTAEMGPSKVKLCDSNPEVWDQWLKDVEKQLEENPTLTLFRAGVNDGNLSGYCVCEKCKAWDAQGGEKRLLVWDGVAEDHVALSDRHLKFANQLARKLKERYPDKDYKVMTLAYGPSLPGPIETKADPNVVVLHTTNWFEDLGAKDPRSPQGTTWSKEFADWSKTGGIMWWRPNLPSTSGMYYGMPDVPFGRVIDTLKFLSAHNCTGLVPAAFWNFWPTQGPLYYMMAQLAWNPDKDGRQILDDYYQRGFGPAAPQMKEYWELMEETRNRKMDENLPYWVAYSKEFFNRAEKLLMHAEDAVKGDREVYGKRIDHVRIGLDYTKLVVEASQLKEDYKTNEKDRTPIGEKLKKIYVAIKAMTRGDTNYYMGPGYFLDKWISEPKEILTDKKE